MENILYRSGIKEDSKIIAALIIDAGGGIVEFLLHDLIKNVTVNQLMQNQVEDETSEFCFKHCIVATLDNSVVGLALAYPSSLSHTPSDGFIPADRIIHLKEFFEKKVPESLYLHALAVLPSARNKGIASNLLNRVIEKAQSLKLHRISLDVWCDNTNALHLYKKKGFKTVDVINIEPHKLLPHKGGMLSMVSTAIPLRESDRK